jgi:hypothetical protein
MNSQFEVLSPWAEADPVPLKGIAPRPTDLAGKKIGLFATAKRASRPTLTVVERKLKERFPTCETSWYVVEERSPYHILQVETKNKTRFEDWIKGLDAVVLSHAD